MRQIKNAKDGRLSTLKHLLLSIKQAQTSSGIVSQYISLSRKFLNVYETTYFTNQFHLWKVLLLQWSGTEQKYLGYFLVQRLLGEATQNDSHLL